MAALGDRYVQTPIELWKRCDTDGCGRVAMSKAARFCRRCYLRWRSDGNVAHPRSQLDEHTYWGVHAWIRSRYGRPTRCEHCGTTDPSKRYEWANISGYYLRDRADFLRLCRGCHTKFDRGGRRKI